MLDEPTSNLDLAHQHGTLKIARDFARAGVGVFIVLHDLNLAAQYADRVMLLKLGRVVACGHTTEVLTPAAISETFAIAVTLIVHPHLDCPLIVPVTDRAGRL